MIISLVISLYTSRAVLAILGADDFGIYNIVGGVVVLFSFLTNAMTNSTQRFLNFTIGLNDPNKIANVFNTAMLAHFTIFGAVLILAETVGLWFVSTQLNIPTERYYAAHWVYQMSIIVTLLNIIVIPYRASIIAIERMDIFAYISIIDVVLKLIIVLILPYFSADSLILYSILLSCITLLNFLLSRTICKREMHFTHFNFIWDKQQYIEQMSFSGWYLFGGVALVGAKQATNILINIFFNVAVNAAVGIANQVRSAIFGFVTSFQTAFNPQIVKFYAAGDNENLMSLIYRSSKFSYYLLFVISLPVVVFCDDILALWLLNVPKYAVSFTQFVVLTSFTEALSAPLWTAIGATGKVERYQVWVSLILLIEIPIVYLLFKLGMNPVWAFVVNLTISIIAYLYRLVYIRKYVNYELKVYFRTVISPCIKVSILSIPVPIILNYLCASIPTIIMSIFCSVIISCMTIYLIGLNKSEKNFVVDILNKFIKR